MTKRLLTLLMVFCVVAAFAQQKTKATFRLDYYMDEPTAEFLIYLPSDSAASETVNVEILQNGKNIGTLLATRGITNSLSVDICSYPNGETAFEYKILEPSGTQYDSFILKKLPKKFNAVQVDKKTGGVLSNGQAIIPFGFYCYSPVQPTLAEEEVVRGFNMLSPYQNIPRSKLAERKIYMDRCAELGMKVNYNLLSVATGGTGYNSKQDPAERTAMLKAEIKAFKDHPALLSWYLADEPDGRKTPPEDIIKLYNIIKEIDPYHPITIVFMHYGTARKYAEGLDIAMGDLYPVPRSPLSEVSRFQKDLSREFFLEKAIWLVPQAFGGNEWWKREPTAAEMRAATYMGLLNGSTGFQYFIRAGMNGFPKSTTAWAEAAAMALEMAEITPYVLSGEVAPLVSVADSLVEAKAYKRGENTIIAAVNRENTPKDISLTLSSKYTGDAYLPFENRTVKVIDGVITDKILGFDSKVYKISQDTTFVEKKTPDNVVVDADFERNYSVGVPDAVYAQVRGSRGSTYFVDSNTSFSGEHSLRLTTYQDGKGIELQHFPMIVKAGATYTLSFWAKAAPTEAFPTTKNYLNRRGKVKVEKIAPSSPQIKLTLRHLNKNIVDTQLLIDSAEWKKYEVEVFVEKQPGQGRDGITLNLTLDTRGMVWVDLVEFQAKK